MRSTSQGRTSATGRSGALRVSQDPPIPAFHVKRWHLSSARTRFRPHALGSPRPPHGLTRGFSVSPSPSRPRVLQCRVFERFTSNAGGSHPGRPDRAHAGTVHQEALQRSPRKDTPQRPDTQRVLQDNQLDSFERKRRRLYSAHTRLRPRALGSPMTLQSSKRDVSTLQVGTLRILRRRDFPRHRRNADSSPGCPTRAPLTKDT